MTTVETTPPGGSGSPEEIPTGSTATPAQEDASRSEGTPTQPEPAVLGHPDATPCSVELPQFEGPLDLLLHLVRRHELDILDIPIAFVCEKYLEYLAMMSALNLEVAGEYLVMAATLAFLKSRELIPSAPDASDGESVDEDEVPDPREELVARLLEYQTFRVAARDLDGMPVLGRDVFYRGAEVEVPIVDPGLAPITLFRLAEAYNRVLERARIHKQHEVVLESISVPARMKQLTVLLSESPRLDFESLFLSKTWSSEAELRSMLVVTLMSVLELTKLGVIAVRQEEGSEAIALERRTSPEEAMALLSVYEGREAGSESDSEISASDDHLAEDHA